MRKQDTEVWCVCLSAQNYEISSLGRVRRCRPGPGTHVGKILKQKHNNSGYLVVCLSENCHQTTRYVHHLVAEAFVGPRPLDYEVNHEDGNKLNNRSDNLQYTTASDNMAHALALQLYVPCHGEDHPAAKMNSELVRLMRKLSDRGWSYNKLAKRFKLSHSCVSKICRRAAWAHVA